MSRLLLLGIASFISAACARSTQRTSLDDFAAEGIIECSFESRINTWLDQNGDGQRGEDEPVLPNVPLLITNATTRRTYHLSTDSTGNARFFLMFAECKQDYVVDALPPEGFELTARLQQVTDYVRFCHLWYCAPGCLTSA